MVRQARWLGIAASLAWIVVAALLASRNETWFAGWRLYCRLTADASCKDTVFILVHWPVIASLMLVPVILGWLLAWGILALRRRTEP